MSTVVLDTITGKSTATTITIGSTPVVSASANSMTIRGEGSNQTSIQQGLAKAFQSANAAAVLEDSHNIASGTDNGTGDYTFAFTSNMTNAEYSISGVCLNASGNVPVVSWNPPEDLQTTSQFNVEQGYTISGTGGYSNFDQNGSGSIHGDLA